MPALGARGRRPRLPPWKGLALFGLAAFHDLATLGAHVHELALFGVGVILLLPVCLPLLPPLYWYLFDWIDLSWSERLAVGVAWGIFWSYLVIVYTFNEALSGGTGPEVRRRFSNSFFPEPHSRRATVSPS